MSMKFRQVEDGLLSFTLGTDIFVVLVNTQHEVVHQKVLIKNHPFKEGDRLCNLFVEYDCITVNPELKSLYITIIKGYPKVYVLIKPPERPTLRQQFDRISPYIVVVVVITLISWIFYNYHLYNHNNRKHFADL